MRKALLVLALMGAAFAGGAAVNGRGLVWARTLIQSRLIGPAVDEELVRAPEAQSAPIPSTPPIPLTASVPPSSAKEKDESTHASQTRAKPSEAATESPPTPPEPVKPDPPSSPAEKPAAAEASRQEPASPPAVEPPAPEPKPPVAVPPPLEPTAVHAAPGSPKRKSPPDPVIVEDKDPALTSAPSQRWADAPDSAPAQAVLPKMPGRSGSPLPLVPPQLHGDQAVARAGLTTGAPEGSTSMSSARSWPELRRRMKQFGVTHYWVEGEPGGTTRFRCVVPVVGGRAVAQHFEAEADDPLLAADAALRRVALWKATE